MPSIKIPLTLSKLVQHAAEANSQKLAIMQGNKSLSYHELNTVSRSAAKAFLAKGIVRGDRIAIWAQNLSEWIIAAIGMQSIGAVLVPLNTRLQGEEAGDILRRSGARLALLDNSLEKGCPLDMLAEVELPALEASILLRGEDDRAESWLTFLEAGKSIDDAQLDQVIDSVLPADVADMLFTSGTTGKAKGVLCTHEQNIRVFQAWADIVGLSQSDRYLIVNPFFHCFGYKAGWLASIISGCSMYLLESFDAEQTLSKIEQDKITVFPGAPSLYEMLIANPIRSQFDLSSLRLAVTGAASIPVRLVHDLKQILGFETAVTGYGLTEACGTVSLCRPEDDPETIATTSGRALDDIEIRCVNPATGEKVPPGSEGEIWVRGYNVMLGYFDMPEATAETITDDGWLRTGDIGILDERGYLKITDRLKDMYIMNGENVYPAEVENVLYGLDAISLVSVIGVPKSPQGEVGMAFIVTRPGASLTVEQVRDHCQAKLARYKVPLYYEFVDSLPMNSSGKVVKAELRAMASAG